MQGLVAIGTFDATDRAQAIQAFTESVIVEPREFEHLQVSVLAILAGYVSWMVEFACVFAQDITRRSSSLWIRSH